MTIGMSLLSGIRYGGVTYFRHLLPELVRQGTEHTFHFFVVKGDPIIERVQASHVHCHEVMPLNQSAVQRLLYEQFFIPFHIFRFGIEIYYTAKNVNILLAPCKTVIAIRNVEPFVFQEYHNHWKLNVASWLKWQMTRMSIKKARAIVAVSQNVKMRVLKRFPRADSRTHVIYNGNPLIHPPVLQTREPFILTASKFVAYANQLSLIEGYALLRTRRPDVPPLWFAGGVHDVAYKQAVDRRVEELNVQSSVRFLGLVPQQELYRLYARAQAFVFPSTLEACPHTLIEVMSCKTPIATTTCEPMPEMCQEGAEYFQPYNAQHIADVLERVLFDEATRERLVHRAFDRQRDFSYAATARQLLSLFSRL